MVAFIDSDERIIDVTFRGECGGSGDADFLARTFPNYNDLPESYEYVLYRPSDGARPEIRSYDDGHHTIDAPEIVPGIPAGEELDPGCEHVLKLPEDATTEDVYGAAKLYSIAFHAKYGVVSFRAETWHRTSHIRTASARYGWPSI